MLRLHVLAAGCSVIWAAAGYPCDGAKDSTDLGGHHHAHLHPDRGLLCEGHSCLDLLVQIPFLCFLWCAHPGFKRESMKLMYEWFSRPQSPG